MKVIKNIKTVFSFYFKNSIRSKRTRFFVIASLIPVLVFLLIRIVEYFNRYNTLSGPIFFSRAGMSFFFQLFIQLLALFFGSAIIADEKERKTLIYLITSPVSRFSILSGKLVSNLASAFFVYSVGISLLLSLTYSKYLFSPLYFRRLFQLNLSGYLSIFAYMSLFLLLSLVLKKSTIVGLVFIFGWEYIAMFIPGSAQKLTIFHYVRSITPIRLRINNAPFASLSKPPSAVEAIISLLIISAVFLTISNLLFKKKEFVLTGNI